jgi:hypothetical protein
MVMFTEREIDTIRHARKKLARIRFSQIIAVIVLAIMVAGIFTSHISGNNFVTFAFILILLTIAQPQLGAGPKYQDLVELLENKAAEINVSPEKIR